MRTRTLSTTALASLALVLAACTDAQHAGPTIGYVPYGNGEINGDSAPGRVTTVEPRIPSLLDMQEIKAAPKPEGTSAEDRLRVPAMRDAALSYGAQGGLAWACQEINRLLNERADSLSRTYQFSRLLIRGPNGVTILPPVISESRDTYEQFDAGKTLRIADQYYEIIEQARFAPVAPLWHSYLLRTYSAPNRPSDELLPKNDGERDAWRRNVAEGWDQGTRQAQEIFQQDMRRLERDFTGMTRYVSLLSTGQVSAPVVASQGLGVTGTGQNMRVDDTVVRITADPRLNVQRPDTWKPPVSDQSPTDAATPPGAAPAANEAYGY